MTTHLSRDTSERYVHRTLRPGELLAVDDHLAACPECRRALSQQDKTWRSTVARLRRDLLCEREAEADEAGSGSPRSQLYDRRFPRRVDDERND